MTMVALPPIALALVYGLGIDPFHRNPYWAALDSAERWCASGIDTFEPNGHFDWSKPEAVYIQDEPGPVTLPCLVKIRFMTRFQRGGCDVYIWALSQDGRLAMSRYIHNWAVQGGQATRSPSEILALKPLIAALPQSQGWIPIGNAVSVGFLDRGVWSTRTYDKARLPPGVSALGKAMDIDFH
jgi:hypothetical protein